MVTTTIFHSFASTYRRKEVPVRCLDKKSRHARKIIREHRCPQRCADIQRGGRHRLNARDCLAERDR